MLVKKIGKSSDVDMTEGSIPRHLISFAIPLLIGNLFQMMYNMVDTWVVGHFVSDAAFSAVGIIAEFGEFCTPRHGEKVEIARFLSGFINFAADIPGQTIGSEYIVYGGGHSIAVTGDSFQSDIFTGNGFCNFSRFIAVNGEFQRNGTFFGSRCECGSGGSG